MEYRFVGRTGLRISELGLGTMCFGGEADERLSASLFHRAVEAGINFFDCADVYNQGRSEEILGRLIASCRDQVVVSTKAYFPTGDGANARGTSRYHLLRAVEGSLRRLATDRVDILFLHRFDEKTDLEETLRGVELLVRQGKVLYPAVSNFAAWQTAKALGIAEHRGWAPLVATQPMYNLVKRQAEAEILPMAQAEGLGVVPYSPLGGGLLSGRYGEKLRPKDGRLVKNPMYATRYGDPAYYAIAESFTALARARGCQPAALGIAWVAAHPAVTAPIIGPRTLDQLEVCLQAVKLRISGELYREISELSTPPPPPTDRNEEGTEHGYGVR